ncbi:MAG TPA: serine/threonine-protein kinase [Ktedonosporobacter sp.]|nr:serine/threonine-protein kinase [Ktedonosporobacter sp.]
MLLEGQHLNQYRIERLLGQGGMGEVYLAQDIRIKRQIALKVLQVDEHLSAAAAEQARRLFEREARAIAQLDHPHILPLYDFGEMQVGASQILYLVMPYRPEGSLSKWWTGQRQAGRQLMPQEISLLVQQAASALQHAHDQGIIHQDVKPANFLIRGQRGSVPELQLADFGIAYLSNASASMSQSIRGTPFYMAPEQWQGHPVPASDQYALAIMAYQMLVGHPPFRGSESQVMYKHLMEPVPPPSAFNPDLSPLIDGLFRRALAKKPQERFLTVTVFSQALSAASGQIAGAVPPAAGPHNTTTSGTTYATQLVTSPPAPDRSEQKTPVFPPLSNPSHPRSRTTRAATLQGGLVIPGFYRLSDQSPPGAPDR